MIGYAGLTPGLSPSRWSPTSPLREPVATAAGIVTGIAGRRCRSHHHPEHRPLPMASSTRSASHCRQHGHRERRWLLSPSCSPRTIATADDPATRLAPLTRWAARLFTSAVVGPIPGRPWLAASVICHTHRCQSLLTWQQLRSAQCPTRCFVRSVRPLPPVGETPGQWNPHFQLLAVFEHG